MNPLYTISGAPAPKAPHRASTGPSPVTRGEEPCATPRKPLPRAAAYAIDDALIEASAALHRLQPLTDPARPVTTDLLYRHLAADLNAYHVIINHLKSIRTAQKGPPID